MAKKTQESGQQSGKNSKGTRSKAKSRSIRSSAPPEGAATATAEPEELAPSATSTDSASASVSLDDETHAKYEQVKRGELHITDLQKMTVAELQEISKKEDIEESAGLTKQDLIFQILKKRIQQNGLMYGEGVLEILPDGFGFLRSPE